MNISRSLAISFIVLALSVAGNRVVFAADSGDNSKAKVDVSTSQSQTGEQQTPSNTSPQGQGALEIAPQLNTLPPSTSEPPAEHSGKPADETPSYEQYQQPAEASAKSAEKSPYLGFVVEDTLKTYGGKEEHGLEIVTIDPNSPAEQAGLKGRGDITPLGAAGVTAGALLGPLTMAVIPLLNKSGQLGKDGDLIVAVDDRRVRGEFDFRDELRKLKPGDTIYLTVVRPSAQGGRQTLKIPVKVGGQSSEAAAEAPPFDPYSMQSPY